MDDITEAGLNIAFFTAGTQLVNILTTNSGTVSFVSLWIGAAMLVAIGTFRQWYRSRR